MTLQTKQRLGLTCTAILGVMTICLTHYWMPGVITFILTATVTITGFMLCLYAVILVGQYAYALFRIVHREVIAMRQHP